MSKFTKTLNLSTLLFLGLMGLISTNLVYAQRSAVENAKTAVDAKERITRETKEKNEKILNEKVIPAVIKHIDTLANKGKNQAELRCYNAPRTLIGSTSIDEYLGGKNGKKIVYLPDEKYPCIKVLADLKKFLESKEGGEYEVMFTEHFYTYSEQVEYKWGLTVAWGEEEMKALQEEKASGSRYPGSYRIVQ